MKTYVLDLVKASLVAQGYDGLYAANGECACDTSDLAPCGEMQQDCIAGHKAPCPSTCGEHDWHIQHTEPKWPSTSPAPSSAGRSRANETA